MLMMPSFPRFGAVIQVPQGTGSNIGTATENGGVAAAFDGNSSQAQSACAYLTGGGGTVGKDYTTGRNIVRWLAWGSTDFGFNNQGSNGAVTVYCEYSDDNSSWTTADNVSVNATPGTIDRTFASVGAHRYWRVRVGSAADTRIAEVQFWEQT